VNVEQSVHHAGAVRIAIDRHDRARMHGDRPGVLNVVVAKPGGVQKSLGEDEHRGFSHA
jgi:hypothetical protein